MLRSAATACISHEIEITLVGAGRDGLFWES